MLCNRSRAAGVIIVPVDELDEVLEEILVPPPDTDAWLNAKIDALNGRSVAGDELRWGSFDEQCRHWWSNESPVYHPIFICLSVLTYLYIYVPLYTYIMYV